MSGPEFFQTRMGARFYEVDVPAIAKSLEKLATFVERDATSVERELRAERDQLEMELNVSRGANDALRRQLEVATSGRDEICGKYEDGELVGVQVRKEKPKPIESGLELSWTAAKEAAERIIKHCDSAGYIPPEAVRDHALRIGGVCEQIDAIVVALKISRTGAP